MTKIYKIVGRKLPSLLQPLTTVPLPDIAQKWTPQHFFILPKQPSSMFPPPLYKYFPTDCWNWPHANWHSTTQLWWGCAGNRVHVCVQRRACPTTLVCSAWLYHVKIHTIHTPCSTFLCQVFMYIMHLLEPLYTWNSLVGFNTRSALLYTRSMY